jgi:Holliday junction resolvase RusA-like endonuclease
MTFEVCFHVEGIPVPKGRPRFRSMGKFVQTYTDTKTRDFEKTVAEASKHAMGASEPLKTPLKVFLQFTLPIPASVTKKRLKSILDGLEVHTKKPDLDNLIKATIDGMDKIVFDNDSQIVNISATKKYGSCPRTDILVTEYLP